MCCSLFEYFSVYTKSPSTARETDKISVFFSVDDFAVVEIFTAGEFSVVERCTVGEFSVCGGFTVSSFPSVVILPLARFPFASFSYMAT